MSDPRLVYRNHETGEGILVDDAGVETSVHLPSVPDLRYVDETRTPSQGSADSRRTVEDGILGGGGAVVEYPPQPPGRQVPSVDPLTVPLSDDRVILPAPGHATLAPEDVAAMRDANAEAAMRASLTSGTLPVDPSAPAPVPGDVPASWLQPAPGVPMPPSTIDRAATEAALHGVSRPSPAPQPVAPGMRGPTPEEVARGRAAPREGAPPLMAGAPSSTGAPRPVRSGQSVTSPSLRTPVMSPQVARDFNVPERFDQTIEELAGRAPDLVDRQTEIAQREAQLASDDARRQQQVVAASEDERRAIETERIGAMQRAQDRYTRAIDRVANARVDPNQWFRDQGAFGTVGATIAVALGALGSAISGSSTNGALDQINQAIDRDIAAQQSEIESGRAAADLEGNMLSVVGGEFDDREAARLAARAAMLDQAQLELQAHTADLASDEALVNAEALRAQLAAASEAARQDALDRQSQRDLRNAQARRSTAQAMRDERRAMGGGGTAAPPRVTSTMIDSYRALVQGGVPEAEASERAGLHGLTPALPPEVTQAEGNVAALEGSLAFLESIVPPEEDIPGMGRLDSLMPAIAVSDEGLVLRRAAEDVVELYGRLHSGGAISDTEGARFARLVGTGAGMSDDDLRRGIAAVRREVDARRQGTPERGAAPDRDLDGAGTWDTP